MKSDKMCMYLKICVCKYIYLYILYISLRAYSTLYIYMKFILLIMYVHFNYRNIQINKCKYMGDRLRDRENMHVYIAYTCCPI